jgi:hypothetical protein
MDFAQRFAHYYRRGNVMRAGVIAIFFLPGILSAQAILQYSIAAGAGTAAGTILGKQVSNALEVVKAATNEAEGVAPTDHKKREEWKRLVTGGSKAGARTAKGAPAPTGPAAVATTGTGSRRRSAIADEPSAFVSVSPSHSASFWWPQPVSPQVQRSYVPEIPETSKEELTDIETGTARDHVVEKLGAPMARVTIPESGKFVEVYYYQARGETVGAVRLADGAVTEVQLAR